MKRNRCVMLIATVAAIAILPVHAELSVEVTKFHQSYPYSGKATVEYTVAGTLPSNAFAQIVINTDDAGAIFVQSNIVAGANLNVIDFASSFDVDSATVSTSGPVTQTVTATFDTYYVWETFFKAAIEPVHAEEPDPDPDDPEPDDSEQDPEEEEVE